MSTIITRTSKGSPLSWVEADANLTNLNNDKLEASALTPYLTSATAASTYETQANAAATYETQTHATNTFAAKSANLSDLTNTATARTNLGLGTAATQASTVFASSGAVTTNGSTMSTSKLLGRTTASTGSIEEIAVGTGLTLAAGTLSASSGVGQQMVRLNTANGYGSTNTMIRRFTNTVTNTGSDITYTDSATLGASFTINTSGVYAISYTDQFTGGSYAGLSLNTSTPATAINSIAANQILAVVQTSSGASGYPGCVAWTGYLSSTDVVRAHTASTAAGSNTNDVQFTIVRVA